MNLLVVESPTKAKTLNKFLGSDFEVMATTGHIKDLPKSKLGIDIENNFAVSLVEVEKRKDTLSKLRRLAAKASLVLIATDPDREGEAIAQHVAEELEDKKVSAQKIKRISFHEITQQAVDEAIAHPGHIDEHLVNAQTARRVLDRLVGYKLSPLLWRKVRIGLSAGRVQTVALRLVVEKEREIEAFNPQEYWVISSKVQGKADPFEVTLVKIDGKKAQVSDGPTAQKIVSELKQSQYQVADVKQKQVAKNPYPPFTTSTLAQSAASVFGWSSKKTMRVAQALYEQGRITYHRTDSYNLSKTATSAVRAYIKKELGDKYLPESPRFFKNRSKNAQEAHEAIRPTQIATPDTNKSTDEGKLYQLIWKRFVACQMAQAVYQETGIDVVANFGGGKSYLLHTAGTVVVFDGFRKVYGGINQDEIIIPKVAKDEKFQLLLVDALQKFTLPPARYNEASLIKMLEKLGIGRPSTYAPTISTIQVRNYVEKEDRVFKPTSIGIVVSDFLTAHFEDIFDYGFTAHMEGDLDAIAKGELVWQDVMSEFYTPFDKRLQKVTKESERVKIPTEKVGRKCPECKKGELVIRTGRFGKFISCDQFPDCKYTEKIVVKVDGMKCPDCKKGDVVLKKGKRGRKFYGCSRYPDCKFASWKKPTKTS